MRPTLRQVFGFSLLALLIGLVLLFYLIFHGSQTTIMASAKRYQDLASRDVAHRVTTYLEEAPMAIGHFEQQVKFDLIDPQQCDSLERALLTILLTNDNISEATLTFAKQKGVDGDGHLTVDLASAGQVAVLRTKRNGEFISRRTWFDGKQFVSQTTTLPQKLPASALTASAIVPAMDPTQHPTFQGAANKDNFGNIIATDLHWSQIDELLPQSQRRVEVSVQKTIEDASGHFAGVLRVGLMKTQIDGAVLQPITGRRSDDPYLIFLCDNEGRLITGFGDKDNVTVSGDDLRVDPADAPPIVARALQEPILKDVGDNHPDVATSFDFGGETYLCTFRSLPGTQDWIVGVVVPRDFYLGPLLRTRRYVICASLALMVLILVTGTLVNRSVLRSHFLILRETTRMNEFEFTPSSHTSYLSDIAEVLGGLEKAKTAMRAMSKYVPVNLVRQLYQKGEEPELGGKSSELSVLFTDIKDFTAVSESMTPDDLAEVLGRYLQVMANTIQSEKGTIDKYIGDAVMTFWNAPDAVPGHEMLACRTALRCRAALEKLYDDPAWGKSPRFETRFGLHRCVASVGHFGAPDRLNYTAIGDGINLASRLEGLNKYYGTHIIASECIYAAAKEEFEFRLLDRVAVKGKTEGIVIYELLSARAPGVARSPIIEKYEQAFAAYQRREFAAALKLIGDEAGDVPSTVLAKRCREFLKHPPGADWNGVYAFDSK